MWSFWSSFTGHGLFSGASRTTTDTRHTNTNAPLLPAPLLPALHPCSALCCDPLLCTLCCSLALIPAPHCSCHSPPNSFNFRSNVRFKARCNTHTHQTHVRGCATAEQTRGPPRRPSPPAAPGRRAAPPAAAARWLVDTWPAAPLAPVAARQARWSRWFDGSNSKGTLRITVGHARCSQGDAGCGVWVGGCGTTATSRWQHCKGFKRLPEGCCTLPEGCCTSSHCSC